MNYGQINYSITENMIDILFVNTNSLDKTFQSLSKYAAKEPPIWSALLAQSLRIKGYVVDILDCEALEFTTKQSYDKIKEINPNVIFVGLGCPNQDIWISEKRIVLNSVFIGIGASFDYYAGTLKRAPNFMQNNGLEWLYRLYKEPKRLFIRYLISIFLFSLRLFLTMFLKIKN